MRMPSLKLPKIKLPKRKTKTKSKTPARVVPGIWTPPEYLRKVALVTGVLMAVISVATTVIALAESYRNLYDWCTGHDVTGLSAVFWPGLIDTFMLMAELGMLTAIVMGFHLTWRVHVFLWSLIVVGLGVSAAANVGHLPASATWTDRATNVVPPVAAWAALSVAFMILKVWVAWLRERDEAGETAGTPDEAPAPVTEPRVPLIPLPLSVVLAPAPEPEIVIGDDEIAALLDAMTPDPGEIRDVPQVTFEEGRVPPGPDHTAGTPGHVEIPDGFDPWIYEGNQFAYRRLSHQERLDFNIMKAEYLWGLEVRRGEPVPGLKAIKRDGGVGNDFAPLMQDYLYSQVPDWAKAAA